MNDYDRRQTELQRESNPEFSLELSKAEYDKTVKNLVKLIESRSTITPGDFVERLVRATGDVDHALGRVQEDLNRIKVSTNNIWYADQTDRNVYRRRRSVYSRPKPVSFDEDV